MTTTNDTTALQRVVDALFSGESVLLNMSFNPTADGGGIQFTGQVLPQQTQGQQPPVVTTPAPPIIVPPIILPPVGPPITPPPVISPVIPPPVVPVSAPPQFATTTHPVPIPATLKTAFPYATNAWWENIILGKNRIAPEPYQIQVVDNGFLCCYPAQAFAQDSQGMQHITTQFLQNMTLEFAEVMGSWAVTKYDDLTITLKWVASNGQSATSVIAQGCPYLSMAYTGTTPLLTTQHSIVAVNGSPGPGQGSSTKFKITLNNGQTWILYCSSPITFGWNGSHLMASGPFTGVVRLACLVNASDETILDQYVTAIPTGGIVSAQYGNSNMAYTFNWNVAGSGQILMCALPHHMDILQSPQTVPTSWRSMKGMTTGVVGNSWTLVEPMPQIQWRAPRPIDPIMKGAIIRQLATDASFINNSTSDTYFASKGLAKMARLLLIADEVGDTASVALISKNLKASLTMWFTQNGLFAYDKTWGGIVFAPALGDSGADFGFSHDFNDHVFHEGYFVYACAVIAKFDAAWLAAYQERVTEIVHDYCNPLQSSDTRYPQIRNKDLYMGHSWAAGLVDFGDNRNLESTSEAINGYYSAMLWGVVTGDTTLQNFAGLMMQMEVRSAIAYWHGAKKRYGSQWTAASASLGWSTKYEDATWFSADLWCRRGIQMLPILPASESYLDTDFVQTMISTGEMATMLAHAPAEWKGFILAALAVIDKASAWQQVNNLTAFDDGQSFTNLMYWIATRP
jgi:endo-1,3(4)-beta-glucanase